MIFIYASGIHNTLPKGAQPDLVKELKALAGNVYRQADHFIQLAVLGTHKAVGGIKLCNKTAIYMTSGQGNVSVFERICRQRRSRNLLPKPVDFVNLLSNSTWFYVAPHLGLEGKNLFVSHHLYPVQMALLATTCDLRSGKEKMVLLGGVDEWLADQERAKKILGLAPDAVLGEASNWLLLGREPVNGAAAVEVIPRCLARSRLTAMLADADKGSYLAFSRRMPAEDIGRFLHEHRHCRRFVY